MVKKGKCCLVLVMTMLVLAAFSGSVLAAGDLVVDQADSFSAAEAAELQASAAALGAQYNMDLVIVTTNDAEGKTARAYADDYFDYNGYGVGADRDGILFLIDFDNREAYISTSGSGIRYLTDARIESILDDVFAGGMSDENYYGAAQAFLRSTAGYLAAGIPGGQYNEAEQGPNSLTLPEGLVGAAASGLSGLGFASSVRKRYKGKTQAGVFDFRRNSLLALGVTQDNLVNTRVTTRIRPAPQPSSGRSSTGRSTTHTSSSGRSHGGGGRRF